MIQHERKHRHGHAGWVAIARMARQGVNVLGLVASGKLPRSMLWLGLDGAAEYVSAIAAGDVCNAEVKAQRDATCMACPSRTPAPNQPSYIGYCGTPLVPRMDAKPPTCGCLLDAANVVASRPCPQGRYVAVTISGE